MKESKLETFQRLFPGRAAKVLEALRVAGHCMKGHMEPDHTMTDEFVRSVRESLDTFPPLDEDMRSDSIPGLEPSDEPRPAFNCFVTGMIEAAADNVVADPARSGGTSFRYSDELTELRKLKLDRAKVAYGLSKISQYRDGDGLDRTLEAGMKLIREGIGRNA